MISSLLHATALLAALVPQATAAPAASTPAISYFNITDMQYYHPNGWSDEFQPDQITCNVYDAATNTTGSCKIAIAKNNIAPAKWTQCSDPTFYMKMDYYKFDTTWNVEFKHQYAGSKGKKCSSGTASDCSTARAYASFDPSLPGYHVGGSASGSVWINYLDMYAARVFSKCDKGCGISSGDY